MRQKKEEYSSSEIDLLGGWEIRSVILRYISGLKEEKVFQQIAVFVIRQIKKLKTTAGQYNGPIYLKIIQEI